MGVGSSSCLLSQSMVDSPSREVAIFIYLMISLGFEGADRVSEVLPRDELQPTLAFAWKVDSHGTYRY